MSNNCTITGTINDTTGAPITSGQVIFSLRPSVDTTLSGTARFVPGVDAVAKINPNGSITASDGSAFTVVKNTALTPVGTYYQVTIQPNGATSEASFSFYAVNDTVDISTVTPTPAGGPFNYAPSIQGMSAYQVAVLNGYSGTETEWLASLVGAAGPPQTFTGPYNAGTIYSIGEAVYGSDGSSYVSLVNGNVGHDPTTSPSQWGLSAKAGTDGQVSLVGLGAGAGDMDKAVRPVGINLFNADPFVITANSAWGTTDGGTTASILSLPGSGFTAAGLINVGGLAGIISNTDLPVNNIGGNPAYGPFFLKADGSVLEQITVDTPAGTTLAVPSGAAFFVCYFSPGSLSSVYIYDSRLGSGVPFQTFGYVNTTAMATAIAAAVPANILIGATTTPSTSSDFQKLNPDNITPNGGGLSPGISLYDNGAASWGMMLAYLLGGLDTPILYGPDIGTSAVGMGLYPAGAPLTSSTNFTVLPIIGTTSSTRLGVTPSTNIADVAIDHATGNTVVRGTLAADGGFTNITAPGIPIVSSDAVAPNTLTSLVQLRSYLMSRSQTPASFIVPYSAKTYVAYGDSITAGLLLPTPSTEAYPILVGTAIGAAATTNNGFSGDQCADMVWKIFNLENPSATSDRCYSLQIGTNDANGGVTGHEDVYTRCLSAGIAWLGTRSNNRVDGGTVSATNWSNDTTFSAVTGKVSSTNAATISYSITTYGKPIYLWNRIIDGNGGTFTVSVDGGAAQAVDCFCSTAIQGQDVNNSVQVTRIPIAAGAHTVTIVVTSATSGSNLVPIVSVGTPSPHTYYISPTVAVGGVIPQVNDENGPAMAAYTMDAMNCVEVFQGDGLDIRYVDNRSAMLDGPQSLYTDDKHPNVAGQIDLSMPYIYALQLPPSEAVNRSTPLSSAGPGTPGDRWAAAGFEYGVQADRTLQRVATATF